MYVHGEEFQRTLPQSYELYTKYQLTIHNDPVKRCEDYKDHLQKTPLKVAYGNNQISIILMIHSFPIYL